MFLIGWHIVEKNIGKIPIMSETGANIPLSQNLYQINLLKLDEPKSYELKVVCSLATLLAHILAMQPIAIKDLCIRVMYIKFVQYSAKEPIKHEVAATLSTGFQMLSSPKVLTSFKYLK